MQHPCYTTQYVNGTYTSIDGYDYLNMQKYPTTLADFGGTFSSLCADSTVGFPQTQEEQHANPSGFCDSQIHASLPSSSTSYYKVQMSLARRGQTSETEPENDNSDAQTDTTAPFLTPNSVTSECSDGYQLDVVPNNLECPQQQLTMPTNSQLSSEEESSDIKPDSSQSNSEDDLKEVEAKLANETEKTIAEIKPPLSYIALIGKAILESAQQRLSLGSIYTWIEKNYPFYKNRGQGWRNSVRHNLSLNDCFIKAGRCEDGKGNYWSIHPANLQDFMRGDFRQRRRSRRRGRKRDCEYGFGSPYTPPPPTGYYGNPPHAPVSPTYHAASSLSSIYSPYSEAERRAYRLDEVLLKQSMNNPFIKWYNNGTCNTGSDFYSPNSAPANYDMYNNNYANNCNQWQPTNYDYGNSQMYPFSPSFSRYVK